MPFPHSLSISSFSLDFLILSPFPHSLHFLIFSPFSHSLSISSFSPRFFPARLPQVVTVCFPPIAQTKNYINALRYNFGQKIPDLFAMTKFCITTYLAKHALRCFDFGLFWNTLTISLGCICQFENSLI